MNRMVAIMKRLIFLFFIPLLVSCQSASEHRKDVEDSGDRLTVGTVQKEIRVGMSGAEVATILGSPNIVTTDEKRREVWVYDKISTTDVRSSSSGFGSLLLIGGQQEDSARSTSQKTFTVVIKFDEQGTVRDFAYHTSRF